MWQRIKKIAFVFVITVALLALSSGCEEQPLELIDRESMIPPDQEKITPETDLLPPILHSDEYEQPVPMPYPINTTGAEDSGFIMPDGNIFYVWFTPDPGASLQEQLADGVTGIYVSEKVDGVWQQPQRVVLQDPDKQSLDGCAFVQDCTMWFCTVRTGYTGLHWFTASCDDGSRGQWENADFNPDYEVGELHITADGKELYFHSSRAGGKGQYDIWVSENENGEWQEPELIISQFAGESSLDNEGNIYFTHHFYKDGVMLEADIYVAYRK